MRKLALGGPLHPQDIGWAIRSLQKIERSTEEDLETTFDGITVTGTYTDVRAIDPTTITHADLAILVATLISDIQKRGERNTGA